MSSGEEQRWLIHRDGEEASVAGGVWGFREEEARVGTGRGVQPLRSARVPGLPGALRAPPCPHGCVWRPLRRRPGQHQRPAGRLGLPSGGDSVAD